MTPREAIEQIIHDEICINIDDADLLIERLKQMGFVIIPDPDAHG